MFIFAVSIIFTANSAFAESPITELKKLTENCDNYAKKTQTYSIIEKYPEFDEKKNKYNENTIELNNKTYKYKYIPLKTVDSTGKSYRVNIYDFNGSSAKEIYANLRSIINKAEKKEIVLRKEIPSENTEDSVKLTTSINDENAGFTCYIKKSDTEYWIKTEPYKNKKAVFIIDGNTGKLYYRENILPNDN